MHIHSLHLLLLLRACRRGAAAILLAVGLAGPAAAQNQDAPAWLHVAVVQVKGGSQGAAFEDLVRQFTSASQAAGAPAAQVFQVVLGHPNEYHIVTPVQSIAGNETLPPPMPEARMATLVSRITDTIDSVRFFYAATFPEHGVEAPANAPPPTLLLLRKIQVYQGKGEEYESWVADQYMPAFRQVGALGHTMSHSIYGDSILNYYHAYPLAGWDDLEGPDPLMEVLGQRRYDQVFGAIDDIVREHEMVVARPRPDLAAQ